jgi:hypothetical protein
MGQLTSEEVPPVLRAPAGRRLPPVAGFVPGGSHPAAGDGRPPQGAGQRRVRADQGGSRQLRQRKGPRRFRSCCSRSAHVRPMSGSTARAGRTGQAHAWRPFGKYLFMPNGRGVTVRPFRCSAARVQPPAADAGPSRSASRLNADKPGGNGKGTSCCAAGADQSGRLRARL